LIFLFICFKKHTRCHRTTRRWPPHHSTASLEDPHTAAPYLGVFSRGLKKTYTQPDPKASQQQRQSLLDGINATALPADASYRSSMRLLLQGVYAFRSLETSPVRRRLRLVIGRARTAACHLGTTFSDVVDALTEMGCLLTVDEDILTLVVPERRRQPRRQAAPSAQCLQSQCGGPPLSFIEELSRGLVPSQLHQDAAMEYAPWD
jgi:hypothetical protein